MYWEIWILILKSGFRIYNRTRNSKTDFNAEISVFGFSFLPFDWEIRKRIWKTVLKNSGLARARIISKKKTAVHENSFANPFLEFSIGEQGMAQWWERWPPTNVARVQIPASTSYVGWVCCWFSPLLRGVFFPGTPVFPSSQKPTFSNSSSTMDQVYEEPLCGCATSKSLFILFILTINCKKAIQEIRIWISKLNY